MQNYTKIINDIKLNLELEKDTKKALQTYISILPYSKLTTSKFICKKIQLFLMAKSSYDLIEYWTAIISYHKCEKLMDDFFDFYWADRNAIFINEIKKLYCSFKHYFLKYIRDMKTVKEFSKICEELENVYNEKYTQLFTKNMNDLTS